MNLSGGVVASICPVPPSIAELKVAIEAQTGMPFALQKLVRDTRIFHDADELDGNTPLDLLLLCDETPLFHWNLNENPARNQIVVDGCDATCPELRTDFVNVLTKEPIRSGVHYFQFVMHKIGDEQWCGVTTNTSMAGRQTSGRFLDAWTYYCGRQRMWGGGSIHDGKGALHVQRRAVIEFEKPCGEGGDVIGMVVDVDNGALAFDLNGRCQGACAVPQQPLYVLTHLDTPSDHVELRKPSLGDAPPASLEALKGPLLKAAAEREDIASDSEVEDAAFSRNASHYSDSDSDW